MMFDDQATKFNSIVCIRLTTLSPYKTPASSFLPSPSLIGKLSKYPFLGNPLSILVLLDPLLAKSRLFQWTPKILKFFILNTIFSFKSNQILW